MNEGVNYFINQLGLSGNLAYSTTGEYFFDGNTSIPVPYSPSYLSSWMMMMTFEKSGGKDGVIFSSYNGDTYKSGFALGVNASNRLYVETYSSAGPAIYELDVDLGAQNAIAVNKGLYNLTLSYFDFNSKSVLSNDFSISNEQFLPSYSWYFGDATNSPSYFSGNPFSGTIDNFLYFSGTVFPNEVATLFSGFTLSSAPTFTYTVANESCSYSYMGLTGLGGSIVFSNTDQLSYCVQTGYLLDQTGVLQAILTGYISGGTATASGYITGYIDAASGYVQTNTSSFSGIINQMLISGVRVFSSDIPSGSSGVYVPFPTSFSTTPIVFTELQHNNQLVSHQISGVNPSGFSVWFSNPIEDSGMVLNVQAALPQQNDGLQVGSGVLTIPYLSSSNQQTFPFAQAFSSVPEIFCQLNSDITDAYEYDISNVTTTGFTITFSAALTQPLVIDYLASTWQVENNFQILLTGLNSGIQSQFIPFSTSFGSTPIVFGELQSTSGDSMLSHEISGVSTSGFTAIFSNSLDSNNYQFNAMAWSGGNTGVATLTTTGIGMGILGQFTDECENVFGMSGLMLVTSTTDYEIPLYNSYLYVGLITGYSTGVSIIQTPVTVPINYSISVNTGQIASFVHTVNYNSYGNSFIAANHTLYYTNPAIQPTPFYVFKNCNQIMGLVQNPYDYNTGYVAQFGMDGVAYIAETDGQYASEVYVYPSSQNKTNVNKSALLNTVKNTFILDQQYALNQVNAYSNGVALLGSGYSISGSIYGTNLVISGDYGISGYSILPALAPNLGDLLIFDVEAGDRDMRSIPQDYSGFSSNIINFNVSSSNLYLNGVKLMSGLDYLATGSTVYMVNPNITGITGTIFSLPLDADPYTRYTGQFSTQLTTRFARGTSMLWTNGIRQDLGEDYLEISSMGLLTGTRVVPTATALIFDNDSGFWS